VIGAGSESIREQVAAGARRLAAESLVHGTAGNVSARLGERIAITCVGTRLGEIDAAQVAVIDLDGRVLEGGRPTSELELHLGVYREHGAGAVVHTHSTVATALSTVLHELPCVHYELLELGGPLRVAPYATFGTPELARNVVSALEGRRAALMANHGVVAYGTDLGQAVERARLVEWVAELYWRAAAIGPPRVLEEGALRDAEAAFAAYRSIDDMSG
jgi:L-fuculose-phosphate aldolase